MATSEISTLPSETCVQGSQPVILAGGRGTRLAPFTSVIPKPLMPIGDEPIVDVLLTQLARQGWTSATLAVGHMADLMRAYCGGGDRYGLDLSYVQETSPLGTVGSLALLPEEQRSANLLVMNGDLLTDLPFHDLVASHAESEAVATIAVQKRPIRMDYGVLDIDESAARGPRILGYREKPSLSATVSMGVYAFSPAAIRYIAPNERLDLPELVQRLLVAGELVSAYEYGGYWLDIGQPRDFEQAVKDFEIRRDEILGPDLTAASRIRV